MHCVVDALVRRRLDVSVRLADADDLGDFPPDSHRTGKSGIVNLGMGRRHARVVVGDAEALELALLVELVDGAQGLFVGRGTVRAVEVPHVDGAVSVG